MGLKDRAKESTEGNLTVTRAKAFDNGGMVFDLCIKAYAGNVTIYNCNWMEGKKNGKDYRFVSFPSRKVKNDDGTTSYYSYAKIELDEDALNDIEKQLSRLL